MLTQEAAKYLLAKVYTSLGVFAKGSSKDAANKQAFALLAKIREAHDENFEEVFSDWLSDVQDTLGQITSDSGKVEFLATIKSAFDTSDVLKNYSKALNSFLDDYQQSFEENITPIAEINIDWEVVNTTAADILKNSVDNYLYDFGTEQAQRITKILSDGVAAGDSNQKIAKQLAEGMDTIEYPESGRTLSPEAWARQTARTAIQEAYVTNTKQAFKNAGLSSWQWLTADDERSCDECLSNDNEIRVIGDDFPSGSEQPGDDHPSCLPPGEMITTKRGLIPIEQVRVGDSVYTHLGRWKKVLALSISYFDGELVKLQTNHSVLLLTPNHPVLHSDGWTVADALNPGDEIVCMGNEAVNGSSLQAHQIPTVSI